MKIHKPYLPKMPNNRYLDMQRQFSDLIMGAGADELKIRNYFKTVFNDLLSQLCAATVNSSPTPFSEEVLDSDAARDEVYYGICYMLKAYSRHFNPAVRKAAKRLKMLFGLYGDIAHKPLREQTVSTIDLLEKMQGEFFDDVVLLNLEDWVEEMERTNDAFIKLIEKHKGEDEAKMIDNPDITIPQLRKKLDEAFIKLCDIIEIFADIYGDEIYYKFIEDSNAVFRRYGNHHSGTKEGHAKKIEEAREWTPNINSDDWNIGDYCFTEICGIKKYYKVIDLQQISRDPTDNFGKFGWKEMPHNVKKV